MEEKLRHLVLVLAMTILIILLAGSFIVAVHVLEQTSMTGGVPSAMYSVTVNPAPVEAAR